MKSLIMKNLFFFLAIAVISLSSSCKDDDAPIGPTGSVNMSWIGNFGGEPLIMILDDYEYLDGNLVKYKDVEFFISNVTLTEEGTGDEVELFEIEHISFSANGTVEDANTPAVLSASRVPAGTYSGIKLGFGVPEDLNKESSNQLGSDHPLRKEGTYWSDWGSYIFTKINGQYDSDGDGEFEDTDQGFSHHLGGDAVYRTITFSAPMIVEENQTLDINVLFDLKALYGSSSADYLDMNNPANVHTNDADDLTVANYMMDNLQDAIIIVQ